jgi:hypothetical protein
MRCVNRTCEVPIYWSRPQAGMASGYQFTVSSCHLVFQCQAWFRATPSNWSLRQVLNSFALRWYDVPKQKTPPVRKSLAVKSQHFSHNPGFHIPVPGFPSTWSEEGPRKSSVSHSHPVCIPDKRRPLDGVRPSLALSNPFNPQKHI